MDLEISMQSVQRGRRESESGSGRVDSCFALVNLRRYSLLSVKRVTSASALTGSWNVAVVKSTVASADYGLRQARKLTNSARLFGMGSTVEVS